MILSEKESNELRGLSGLAAGLQTLASLLFPSFHITRLSSETSGLSLNELPTLHPRLFRPLICGNGYSVFCGLMMIYVTDAAVNIQNQCG